MENRFSIEGRKADRPRIAASSYLNTAPLIWSFMYGLMRGDVELVTDTAPARCADMLARREVDVALVPVIEYQRIPDLAIVPGVCVGSRSSVKSVVLVMRDELVISHRARLRRSFELSSANSSGSSRSGWRERPMSLRCF